MFQPYVGSRASRGIKALMNGPLPARDLAEPMGVKSNGVASMLFTAIRGGAVIQVHENGQMVYYVDPSQLLPPKLRDGRSRLPKPRPLPPMSLADIANTGDTPCDRYACPQKARCATGLACNAWVIYVATGRAHNPRRFALPTAETLAIAEREGVAQVGRHGVAWKSMFIDKPELWA